MAKPTTWCVNFDNDQDVLNYGLKHNLWLMQYQYSHNGDTYQGGSQSSSTTKNWKRLQRVKAGDFLVAYVPSNTFYAIGKVRTPRKESTQEDTVERVTNDRTHNDTGVVQYTDVFYEDFTDTFERGVINRQSKESEIWRYNQRIDVEIWKHVVDDGVEVQGMGNSEPRPDYRSAAFEIPHSFFDTIKAKLSQQSGEQDGSCTPQLKESASKADDEGYFEPGNLEDERERKLREIVQRRGQPEFRNKLVAAYDGRCAVTGCDAVSALEAAHITPYLGPESNHVTNGLLLRADIHTLLDLNLIGIDPESFQVVLTEQLRETCYEAIDGQELTVPDDAALAPSKEALQQRWISFNKDD